MYQNYNQAVTEVMAYLTRNNYTSSIVYTHKRCFRLFKMYLVEKDAEYSHELAMSWLEDAAPNLCLGTLKNYLMALSRINDVLENRKIINTKKAYEAVQYCKYLGQRNKELLNVFLDELSVKYKAEYIQRLRASVSRFLVYASNHGANEVSEITHKLIFNYYRDDKHKNQKAKNRHNREIRIFLRCLARMKLVRTSIPLALDKIVLSRLIFIEEVPANDKDLYYRHGKAACIVPEEFYFLSIQLSNDCLKKHRYSLTIRKNYREIWDELFVFLEANGLAYSQELALYWAIHMRCYTIQWRTFRRAIKIFEQYRNSGDINPAITYSYSRDRADYLPEWCQKEYKDFMAERQREGFALSTFHMYRNSCLRFLEYLIQADITAWEDISPEVIKQFHLSDPHSTSEAKNAYASKIRTFLEYLGDKCFVPSSLHLALSNECAPKVNIIKTLNRDDLKVIYDSLDHEQSSIQLRNAAMIILGVRMGIRASDITKLRLSDIYWDKAVISVEQQKTDKFIKLPMPTEVGNCLFRYIIRGRPSTTSEYIFIRHKVPYGKLCCGVCARALKQVLPNNPHGFHITRKTFASRMLTNSTKAETIAETLGHNNKSTVMVYLSTDGNSMRQCAISLEGIEVKGGMLL
ncbi:MAG TPA: hypothetical protein DD381_09720 [Lentisphaeria bacterium]|nr:MAG: hypothetical protein A2X47_07595 [Lentisphaerae bacterium GWF2_38_69]HBM16602.1 hypothetical protein [Lentisphaeria bacterium]